MKKREFFGLRLTLTGLGAGFIFGLVLGLASRLILSLFDAKLEYAVFLKGSGPLTVGRIFLGNLAIALLLHHLPDRFPKRKNLPAILIGTVGAVLGFFGATADISPGEYLVRLPHTVLEIFAYVVSASGGRLWPAILAISFGALSEWLLVLG